MSLGFRFLINGSFCFLGSVYWSQGASSSRFGMRTDLRDAGLSPPRLGHRRAGYTNVRLRVARKGAVGEALTIAWRNRAPKRLAAQMKPSDAWN